MSQWYYQDDQGSFGPFDDAGFKLLIQQGSVQSHTLIHRGDGKWMPASILLPKVRFPHVPELPKIRQTPKPPPADRIELPPPLPSFADRLNDRRGDPQSSAIGFMIGWNLSAPLRPSAAAFVYRFCLFFYVLMNAMWFYVFFDSPPASLTEGYELLTGPYLAGTLVITYIRLLPFVISTAMLVTIRVLIEIAVASNRQSDRLKRIDRSLQNTR